MTKEIHTLKEECPLGVIWKKIKIQTKNKNDKVETTTKKNKKKLTL